MGDTVFSEFDCIFHDWRLVFFRGISKKALIKSAHILLAYHVVIFALGEVLEKSGMYVVYIIFCFYISLLKFSAF